MGMETQRTYLRGKIGEQLARKADGYREAQRQLESARAELAKAAQLAYGLGMRKADILRATDHVWSREWLDRALHGVSRLADTDQGDVVPPSRS